ncbi:MAG TPA: PaaI family thioesterase [Kofleriaceae bacterium]
MGLRIIKADATEVVAELDIARKHMQAAGLVHGAVFCGIIESIVSMGASIAARADGRTVVGIENQTSFLRAVKSGTLVGRATPLHIGKTTQLWAAEIRNSKNEVCANGRVRLMCIELPTT